MVHYAPSVTKLFRVMPCWVPPVQSTAASLQVDHHGSKVELRGNRLDCVESNGVSWVGR